MKKLCYTVCAVLALLLGAGCEKTIEFRGEETEPRLTVTACAEAGNPLVAYVASSVFFLKDDNSGSAYLAGLDTLRGQVRCYVNGSREAHMFTLQPADEYASTLCYLVPDYVPSPGDHIRLEADFPGFDPVWAETSVPRMPAFELVSYEWRDMDTDAADWYYGEDSHELEVTLAVTDDATYDKYYFVQPVLQYQFEYCGDEPQFQRYEFSSNDMLFRDMSGANAMAMIDEEGNYFSDKLIKGQRHEFTITVSYLPKKEEGSRMWIHTAAVNEDLYWYDYSYSNLGNMTGLFAEGVTLYSNVNGGYGVFSAAASVWFEVDW